MNPDRAEDHKTVYVKSIDADIDEQIVDLVLEFNGSSIKTVSSCQGDPGIIGEGGQYGHITFRCPDSWGYEFLARVMFSCLFDLTKDMWDDVRLEMTASDTGFLGWVYFRNETIPDLLKRLRDFGIR
jgi:hypothetical protein